MKKIILKYSALFLVALFLFPSVEKTLHSFEHHNDTHCNSSQKHFHSQEHNCVICDYNIQKNNTNNPFSYEVSLFFSFIEFASNSNIVAYFATYSFSSPRAPPLLSSVI